MAAIESLYCIRFVSGIPIYGYLIDYLRRASSHVSAKAINDTHCEVCDESANNNMYILASCSCQQHGGCINESLIHTSCKCISLRVVTRENELNPVHNNFYG